MNYLFIGGPLDGEWREADPGVPYYARSADMLHPVLGRRPKTLDNTFQTMTNIYITHSIGVGDSRFVVFSIDYMKLVDVMKALIDGYKNTDR